MLNENWLTHSKHVFKEMDNLVHINQKWFDMTMEKNTYCLHSLKNLDLCAQ
jgi:hypothetical protein